MNSREWEIAVAGMNRFEHVHVLEDISHHGDCLQVAAIVCVCSLAGVYTLEPTVTRSGHSWTAKLDFIRLALSAV